MLRKLNQRREIGSGGGEVAIFSGLAKEDLHPRRVTFEE